MLGNWFVDEDGEDYTFDERSSLYLRSKSHSGAFLRNANEPGTLHSPRSLFCILHCVPHFSSPSLSLLLPYLRHMAELWTVEQGARPAQN